MTTPEFDMDKKFMYVEDNEDGTMTWTVNLKGIEVPEEFEEDLADMKDEDFLITFVAPMRFEDLVGPMFGGLDSATLLTRLHETGVIIPNSPDDHL